MNRKNLSKINKSKNNPLKSTKHKKQKVNNHKKNSILKSYLCVILSLGIILTCSFFITKKFYINNRCTDLVYSVEHNFTTGLNKKNKLLRVQQMSLVYSDGENAIVEASGLSKTEPHKKISLKGNFKKDKNKAWILQKIYTSTASID